MKAGELTEHQEQVMLFNWARMQSGKYPELAYMFAVPNGAFLGGKTGQQRAYLAHKLKSEGLKPGVPDIFLPCARGGYHGLFIEMKRSKGGRLSTEQAQWIADLLNQGYAVYKAEGWVKAKEIIESYLKIPCEKGRSTANFKDTAKIIPM